jgi:hypothetical protein
MPIPGPRPRPRHVPPPPRATMVRPRVAGSSSVPSEPVEGVLLTGMTVTVFPGKSSRSLAEAAAVLAGWATGSGIARTGAATVTDAKLTLGSRGRELKVGRTVRSWTRSWCVSTGEAISTAGVCGTSVRSRCGTEREACSLASDPHPATTTTKAVSGSRKMVRMNPPRVERQLFQYRTTRRTLLTLRLPVAIRDAAPGQFRR